MRSGTSGTCSAVAYGGLWPAKTHQEALATSLRASRLERLELHKRQGLFLQTVQAVQGWPEHG